MAPLPFIVPRTTGPALFRQLARKKIAWNYCVFERRCLEFRMAFIRIYLRVLGLLRSDAKLAIALALANIALAGAQFVEPAQ